MKFMKVGHFNFKLLLIRLFGRNAWMGTPGAKTSAFVRVLGNWVYVHSDARVEVERRKLSAKIHSKLTKVDMGLKR